MVITMFCPSIPLIVKRKVELKKYNILTEDGLISIFCHSIPSIATRKTMRLS